MKKIFFVSLIVLLTATVFFLAHKELSLAQQFPFIEVEELIGSNAPDFALKDLDGRNVTFSSFRGKTILLNFWATWCPYCRQERASLNNLYKKFKSRDFQIVAVSVDRSVSKVKKFLIKNPAEFVILSDTEREAAAPYNVTGLPTSYLIDREGVIRHKYVGMKDWSGSGSIKQIETLLK